MKKFFTICTVLCLVLSTASAQDGSPTQAPESNVFQLGSDDLGALSNSVNLFTGDVQFPVNLASISGRAGLGASLSIAYKSNVSQ